MNDKTLRDYYRQGRARGLSFASDLVVTIQYSDVINEDNWEEAVRDAAYDNEASDRDFSPFEFTAHEINSFGYGGNRLYADEAWMAFDAGIDSGINIAIYLHARKNRGVNHN